MKKDADDLYRFVCAQTKFMGRFRRVKVTETLQSEM